MVFFGLLNRRRGRRRGNRWGNRRGPKYTGGYSNAAGCSNAKGEAHTEKYLANNPNYLNKYMLRNPSYVDNFVSTSCSKERVKGWYDTKYPSNPGAPINPGAPVNPGVPSNPDKPTSKAYLKYLSVDYMSKVNTEKHFTHEYVNKDLVVRRAAEFNLKINFKNRTFDKTRDEVFLILKIGDSPAQLDGTYISIKVSETKSQEKWACWIAHLDTAQNSMVVSVNIPSDVIIGRYKVSLEINSKDEGGEMQFRKYTLGDIIIIFNPFSRTDDVFMENEKERNEYVMNDQGKLYLGSYWMPRSMNWFYGQFEQNILDITLRLLKEGKDAKADPMKSLKMCKSPVYVSRMLSAMVNVNDDNGVLYGRWDGKYAGGFSPTAWNGSVNILKRWDAKNAPVKYGQCWVFSGILTTVLRALGIPSRSTTNFNSAHDTEYNMSIDDFCYSNGRKSRKTRTSDSIWNFHVWNDAWMKRADLPYTGYDGWQSVDSTPQEPSSGIYQCGPAPMIAIKNGDVHIGHDTGFVFGEVNADKSTYLVDGNEKILKLLKKNTNHCGKKISTKQPGTNWRMDVTNDYKHPEGSTEERAAFERAKLRGKLAPWHKDFKLTTGAITIDIKSNTDKLLSNENAVFTVKVTNTGSVNKNCDIISRIDSMMYNGVRLHGVKEESIQKNLASNESYEYVIQSSFQEHGYLLDGIPTLRCLVTVRCSDTELYLKSWDLVVKHPKCLAITLPSGDNNVKEGMIDLKYKITNLFPVQLNNFVLKLEGKGVFEEINIPKFVEPGSEIEGTVKCMADRAGSIKVAARLNSNEVQNITKSFDLKVSS